MAVKIGHASIDERGKAQGGSAGDQTGKEVCTRKWYKDPSAPWHTVLRPKTAELAEKSAKACEDACANSKVGYDQGGRNTLHKQAKAVGFELSKISTACECDCSSLMHVCALAGGAEIEYGSNGANTRNMVNKFTASGAYESLTDEKYLTSDDYLKRGDILVKSGHTVMILEDGALSASIHLEFAPLKKGSQGKSVEAVQRILSTYGYNLGSKNPFDGKFGDLTQKAVIAFQKANKIPQSGEVNQETLRLLFGI